MVNRIPCLWNIEENRRWANTEPSINFKRANTEPSMNFRKRNKELSMQFRRANTVTYYKLNINLSKSREGQGIPQAGRAAARAFPPAPPSGNPSDQPCQPSEKPVLPFSFNKFNPILLDFVWFS